MEQSPELKEVILRYYDAFASGDYTIYERMLSQTDGLLGIGTDPNEWWDSHATLVRISKAQIQELKGAGVSFIPGDLQCYREGSVGWSADRPTLRLPDGTNLPLRMTTVFHQENGEWKMVQFHTSIGVPNSEAVGAELPT